MSEIECGTALGYAHDARRGRLRDAHVEQLAKHLASCVDCRNRHRVETGLDAALTKLPRTLASDALSRRLSAMLDAPKPSDEAARRPSLSPPPARSRFPRWIAGGAALAAAA